MFVMHVQTSERQAKAPWPQLLMLIIDLQIIRWINGPSQEVLTVPRHLVIHLYTKIHKERQYPNEVYYKTKHKVIYEGATKKNAMLRKMEYKRKIEVSSRVL